MPASTPHPELETKEAKKLESERRSLSDKSSTFIGLETQVNHKLSAEELDALPQEIKGLCEGIPSYNVSYVKTQLSKESFLHSSFFDENDGNATLASNHYKEEHFTVGRRTKRQAINWSQCAVSESLVMINLTEFIIQSNDSLLGKMP